jgi:hypothetical protein
LVIQLKEQTEKKVLNQQSAWLEQVALSVKVLPDLYLVLVYRVCINKVNTTNQTEAAKDLELQNASLHPGLYIKQLSWSKEIQKTEKLSLSLTIFLTLPEIANRVIKQRLVESREVKIVERFQTGCELVQCFKCCVYRHIAKHCQAEAQCSYCSRFHKTCNCPNNKEKTFCRNCLDKGLGSTEYKVWSESCPVYKRTREALAVRFGNRLLIYLQSVRPDHCPAISLVVEKELEKQRPGCHRVKSRLVASD